MLVYIFKRSRLNPAWPRGYLEEAFGVFPPRTKHISTWGKLARKAPTPKLMKQAVPIELRVREKVPKGA